MRNPRPPDAVMPSESGLDEVRDWTKLESVPTRVSSSRFVGRRAELMRLEEIWKAAVADERATTVLVAGEAGGGKSDRKSGVEGKRVDLGGRRITKKKKTNKMGAH